MCAHFTPEILQPGAVKGLISSTLSFRWKDGIALKQIIVHSACSYKVQSTCLILTLHLTYSILLPTETWSSQGPSKQPTIPAESTLWRSLVTLTSPWSTPDVNPNDLALLNHPAIEYISIDN